MRHAHIGTYAQHGRCRAFYATRWLLLASSWKNWYLMRYARVSFRIQARPVQYFPYTGQVPQHSHAFLCDRLAGLTTGHKFACTRIIVPVYSEWKLFYVCSSSPSVYYLDWAYFCGARRYRSRIARRDVAHACDPVTRQVGKSTMVLSRPIRGSLRTTGRFDPRPMCEYEGFLTPSASVRVLIE